jgi:hypothetical protein
MWFRNELSSLAEVSLYLVMLYQREGYLGPSKMTELRKMNLKVSEMRQLTILSILQNISRKKKDGFPVCLLNKLNYFVKMSVKSER